MLVATLSLHILAVVRSHLLQRIERSLDLPVKFPFDVQIISRCRADQSPFNRAEFGLSRIPKRQLVKNNAAHAERHLVRSRDSVGEVVVCINVEIFAGDATTSTRNEAASEIRIVLNEIEEREERRDTNNNHRHFAPRFIYTFLDSTSPQQLLLHCKNHRPFANLVERRLERFDLGSFGERDVETERGGQG